MFQLIRTLRQEVQDCQIMVRTTSLDRDMAAQVPCFQWAKQTYGIELLENGGVAQTKGEEEEVKTENEAGKENESQEDVIS